ncbi:hypothetical protein [Hymenobacter elongatus]|uniref:Lipoprotein n=1 Tax=Hymenobacter elongatus TaxID=877208 RepID=A0A4Z0PIU0_9BACT|nr:hypothetical protein [Hymenobacter elongatus]TGE15046.1 hypothetical protein E5J99_13485 [Hymenobacter elongatus]
MTKRISIEWRALLPALLVLFFQSCAPSTEELPSPTTTFSLTVSEARAWYNISFVPPVHSGSNTLIVQGNAIPNSTEAQLLWQQAISVRQGSEQLMLVPLANDQALFTGRSWQGLRCLIIAKKSNHVLDGNIVELLLRRTPTPIDTVTLFTKLYHSYQDGYLTAPSQGEGYVLLYSADYRYLTGRKFNGGKYITGVARLRFKPYATSNFTAQDNRTWQSTDSESGAHATNSACTDWYSGNTGEYITTTGDCWPNDNTGYGGGYGGGSSGWGDGSFGWGGVTPADNSGGGLYNPTWVQPKLSLRIRNLGHDYSPLHRHE